MTLPFPSRAAAFLIGAGLLSAAAAVAAVPALVGAPSDAAGPVRAAGAHSPGSGSGSGSGPMTPVVAASLGSLGPAGSLGSLGPLAELAIRRIQLADQVAAAKRGTGANLDDPARERQELTVVREQAARLGLAPGATARFFEDQIEASKVVQRGLLERWSAHPAEAPAERPSLASIRTELDAITQEILRELVATAEIRQPTAGCTAALASAAATCAAAHHLDTLHREALRVALRSACAG